MKTVVIIAEKPNVAQDIATGIAGRKVAKTGACFRASTPGVEYLVTYAYGHLIEIDDSVAPGRWTFDTLPILPVFRYRVIDDQFHRYQKVQFDAIKGLLAKTNEVVIACDAGREGELIGRLILNQCRYKGPLFRLWTSKALTPDVVRQEMQSLKPGKDFDSLYQAALARMHADWKLGINCTRAVTLKAQSFGGKGPVWSVGRVQTPVLGLIIQRDLDRENFKPEPYAIVKATFEKEGQRYEGIYVPGNSSAGAGNETNACGEGGAQDDDAKHRLSRMEAMRIAALLARINPAVVAQVTKEEKREFPPLIHSLTSLQREANSLYGFSAQHTLDIAQDLYDKHKCISYPRTDAQVMSESNMALAKDALKRLGLAALVSAVDRVGKRVFDDSRLTDHHGLIPLAILPVGVTDSEKKVYGLVRRKFEGAFMPAYRYELTTVLTGLGSALFQSTGRRDIDLGWRSLYKNEKRDIQALPALTKGAKVRNCGIAPEDKETKPPAAYTEATLLKAMERLGLGTPATRAETIEGLKKKVYIMIDKKQLYGTAKGRELISKLSGSQVVEPKMTAKWEKELDDLWKNRKGVSGYNAFQGTVDAFVKAEVTKILTMSIGQGISEPARSAYQEKPYGGKSSYGSGKGSFHRKKPSPGKRRPLKDPGGKGYGSGGSWPSR